MTIMELTPHQYSIQMWAKGADIVDRKYHVAENALRNLNADMDKYLTRKANEAAQATLARYK